jgi:hypothetical protein
MRLHSSKVDNDYDTRNGIVAAMAVLHWVTTNLSLIGRVELPYWYSCNRIYLCWYISGCQFFHRKLEFFRTTETNIEIKNKGKKNVSDSYDYTLAVSNSISAVHTQS